MSVIYYGAHAIVFQKYNSANLSYDAEKNTWDDFHLVPASLPIIEVPRVRTQYVTLPRSNTVVDLTNALTTDIIYEVLTGQLSFIIDYDQWGSWHEAYNDISDYFDGSYFKLYLIDDPETTYVGRVVVANYDPGKKESRIQLNYTIDAYTEED